MSSPSIQNPGFLIDFDGLLINSEELSMVAFERMCVSLGCQFTQDYHASIRGKKKSQWSQDFVSKFSLEESGQTVADLHTAFLLEEMDRFVSLMPGAMAMLIWIRESDYPAVLVTSSDLNYALTYLNKPGIADSFQQIVTAEDVVNGKPNPEPYLIGAQRIGKDPGCCIVLEDSVNGVLAGKASGATVIAVPSTKSDREQMRNSDYVVSSLVEALEIMKEMGL